MKKPYLMTNQVVKRIAKDSSEQGILPELLALFGRESLIPNSALSVLYEAMDAYPGRFNGELLHHLPTPDNLKRVYSKATYIESDDNIYYMSFITLMARKMDFTSTDSEQYFDRVLSNFSGYGRSSLTSTKFLYQLIANDTSSSKYIDENVYSLQLQYGEDDVSDALSYTFDYAFKTPELITKLKNTKTFNKMVEDFLSDGAPCGMALKNPYLTIEKRLEHLYSLSNDVLERSSNTAKLTSSYLSKADMEFLLDSYSSGYDCTLSSYQVNLMNLLNGQSISESMWQEILSKDIYNNSSIYERIEFLSELIEHSVNGDTKLPHMVCSEALILAKKMSSELQGCDHSPASRVLYNSVKDLVQLLLTNIEAQSCLWDQYPPATLVENYKYLSQFLGDKSIANLFLEIVCILNKDLIGSELSGDKPIHYDLVSKYAESYDVSEDFVDKHYQDKKLGPVAIAVIMLSNLPYAFISNDEARLASVIEMSVKLMPQFVVGAEGYMSNLSLYQPFEMLMKELHTRYGDEINADGYTHSITGMMDRLAVSLKDDDRFGRLHNRFVSYLLEKKLESTKVTPSPMNNGRRFI